VRELLAKHRHEAEHRTAADPLCGKSRTAPCATAGAGETARSALPIAVQVDILLFSDTEGRLHAVSRLLADETFRHLVEVRYYFKEHLTGEFELAIAAANEIISELEESME
jgi:hypothetical protein